MLKNLLKETLQEYKPFLQFLAKFFICYLVLTFLYQNYLEQFDQKNNQIDSFTISVGNQTIGVLKLFDDNAYTINHLTEPSVKIFYKDKYVSRIIEGCNAISVMILFISFVVAFTGKFKNTLWFIPLGMLAIHIINILRIVSLSLIVKYAPDYLAFNHTYTFTILVYAFVFWLWLLWSNKYSNSSELPKANPQIQSLE